MRATEQQENDIFSEAIQKITLDGVESITDQDKTRAEQKLYHENLCT